jgi:hypothetical protein
LLSNLSRIASDLKQRRGAGMEQQVIDDALVLQCEWGKFTVSNVGYRFRDR